MKETAVSYRVMDENDWEAVSTIYREGIETGNATFQTTVPGWEEWDKAHVKSCRLVACVDGVVAGWAALTPVSGRCVYAGVGEVSIYIGEKYRGMKLGNALLDRLVDESEKNGFWTLQAGVFPENTASIRLHEKHGFRIVGHREKIGRMNGIWRDTVLLERRSKITGME